MGHIDAHNFDTRINQTSLQWLETQSNQIITIGIILGFSENISNDFSSKPQKLWKSVK